MRSLLLIFLLWGTCSASSGSGRHDTPGHLYLTPYISGGRVEEARNLSKIEGYKPGMNSGFFTVDAEKDTNLFGLFFNSIKDSSRHPPAPLIVWIFGSPVDSNVFESCPLTPHFANSTELSKLGTDPWSLLHEHSIFIIHSVPGLGFSHTRSEEGLSRTHGQVADNVIKVLDQFYKMFPEQKSRKLFFSGQGANAKIATVTAHQVVQNADEGFPRVEGVILGSPFLIPEIQVRNSEFLYNSGLVDKDYRELFANDEQTVVDLIREGKHERAGKFWDSLYDKSDVSQKSAFEVFTGYKSTYNLMDASAEPAYFKVYREIFNTPEVRRMFHVDSKYVYREKSDDVKNALLRDVTTSVKGQLEDLLNAKVKILLYTGLLNVKFPSTKVSDVAGALSFEGKERFGAFSRKVWRVDDELAGYVKHSRHLFEVAVRGSGHLVGADQPKWLYKLINIFTTYGHRPHGRKSTPYFDFD